MSGLIKLKAVKKQNMDKQVFQFWFQFLVITTKERGMNRREVVQASVI